MDDKSRYIGEKVGYAEQQRAGEVEREIARGVGGKWEEDNDFYDVKTSGRHYLEVKTRLKGSKPDLSVHPDALLRKVDGIKARGGTFHTIAVDERNSYQGGAFADRYSGHRLYYKRGSGRYRLVDMLPVKNMKQLQRLINTPDYLLPEKARGSLPTGKVVEALRKQAEASHTARLAKDRDRKARLKAEGKSAYERQT